MMQLVFASHNQHKVHEIQSLLASKSIEIISLSQLGFTEDIPETGATIEANASQKAFSVFNKYGLPCFADDTGLEVEALHNKPGVHSARYAGADCLFEYNIQKLLKEMQHVSLRRARFRTVISLIINGKEILFEGRVNGEILTGKHGQGGFGYDPIFSPDGFEQTFAEMPLELKNSISHRGLAMGKLIRYLETIG